MRKTQVNNKKIALIILTVIIFNIFLPIYSHAGAAVVGTVTSIITKPTQVFWVNVLDQINGTLAVVFASDAKMEGAVDDAKTAWETFKTSKDQDGFLSAILGGLDKFETAWYNLLLSPDDIFTGKVQIANANVFSSKFDENAKLDVSDLNVFNHVMKQLKQTTAGLYYMMRNLAVVILLCALIYCGIRIVFASANANEKAQWKGYLMDWIKSLALVMFIHIIMITIFYGVDILTEAMSNSIASNETIVTQIRKNFEDSSIFDALGGWIYIIMYAYVTYLTIVFLIAYFKRLFFIVISVIIAPVISSLYAIGKTTKSNFNRFFKNFIMGILVQPFHLLIYGVLFAIPLRMMGSGAGLEIAGVQVSQISTLDVQIYALMSIAMVRPIERYMRKILGFGETLLDNVASFDSGKKTLDTGIKIAEQAAKTVVMVAATAATAGAAAAPMMGGGAAAAGGGAAAATGGAAGTAASSAVPVGGMAGGMPPVGMAGEIPLVGGENGQMLFEGFGNGLNPSSMTLTEGQGGQLFFDQFSDVANPDTLTSTNSFIDGQGNANSNVQDGINGRLREEPTTTADQQIAQNGNNLEQTNGNTLQLDDANVQIHQANAVDVNSAILARAQGAENSALQAANASRQQPANASDQKPEVDGSVLGRSLRQRLNDAFEDVNIAIDEKGFGSLKDTLSSTAFKDQLQDLRSAAHEFTDSFYLDQAPGDWKVNVEHSKAKNKEKQEEKMFKFVNDDKNIQKVAKEFNLHDKTDSNGNVITAEQQAKEKLEKMGDYVARGITDVSKIVQLQSMASNPDTAIKTYAKTTAKVNNFVNNTNNVQSMRNIVADRMNLSQQQRRDPRIVQQVKQEVNQVFKEGEKYITSGAARDTATLDRLVQLERKIDSAVTLKPTSGTSKTEYVVRADKLIEKALKDGLKTIKIPQGNANNRAFQTALNEELNRRRRQTQQTMPGGTSGRQTRQNPSSSSTSSSSNTSTP